MATMAADASERATSTLESGPACMAANRLVDTELGANPGTELLSAPKYRYVDFEGAAKMVIGAHRYFVADPNRSLSKHAHKLFSRVFTSQDDVLPGENLRKVYPVICTPDGSVCYMGGGTGTST